MTENQLAELKSVTALSGVHPKQVLTQLRLSGLKLGLLINFGETHLKNGIKESSTETWILRRANPNCAG